MIISIDPGYNGCIAVLGENEKEQTPTLIDTPTFIFKTNRYYDVPAIMAFFLRYQYALPIMVGIERTVRYPKLAEGIGCLMACASVAFGQEKIAMIPPMIWQRGLGIMKADKKVSMEMARHEFPMLKDYLVLAKNHDRAEALLIGLWMRRNKGTVKEMQIRKRGLGEK